MKTFEKLAVAALVAAAAAGAVQAAGPAQPTGVWRNPKNSVHVRIQPCGANVCGTVVWANARAQEKARAGGTARLIGTQLFREFRREGPDSWAGRVFVPDRNQSYSGTLRLAGPNQIVARGCLLGRYLCRSQTWSRVS
ncbi:MAG TPA: DUF2147 domain-containing protein [Allosphingosinicella sp.]|jgi:uncharacterized protein (DUF2147 family)